MRSGLQEIIRRSKAYNEADFLPAIFGKEYVRKVMKGNTAVVLFGAGSAGKELLPLLRLHGVQPVCFCDSKSQGEERQYCGLPVISLSDLEKYHKDSLIIITSGPFRDEIRKKLAGMGFLKDNVFAIDNQEAMCYYTHLYQWYWSERDLLFYEKELNKVYSLLSDQKSKEIFSSRISLFVKGADYRNFCDFIMKYSDVKCPGGDTNFLEGMNTTNYDKESYLQFNNDLLRLEDGELFVDGGAYTGDSAIEFIKACRREGLEFRKIFCYEPDRLIFEQLKENTSSIGEITLKPFGLWSHSEILRFADSSILRAGSTKILTGEDDKTISNAGASGITEIPVVSIDEEFPNEDITLIKMDIEGAEIAALRGAEKTIKKCRPKLIISVYHKRNDLFEIPLLINELVPEYKIYLRHFSNNFTETTLFAMA